MSQPQTTVAGRRPLWLGLAGLGLVGTAGVLVTKVYTEPFDPHILQRILVVSPTWIVAGAVALSQRPGNRTGSRVEALLGVFTVESPPGSGTRVRAEIPCG